MDVCERVTTTICQEKKKIKKAFNKALCDIQSLLDNETLTVVDNKYVSPVYPILVWNSMDEYPEYDVTNYFRDTVDKIHWHIEHKTISKPVHIYCRVVSTGDHRAGSRGIQFTLSLNLTQCNRYIPSSLDYIVEH